MTQHDYMYSMFVVRLTGFCLSTFIIFAMLGRARGIGVHGARLLREELTRNHLHIDIRVDCSYRNATYVYVYPHARAIYGRSPALMSWLAYPYNYTSRISGQKYISTAFPRLMDDSISSYDTFRILTENIRGCINYLDVLPLFLLTRGCGVM